MTTTKDSGGIDIMRFSVEKENHVCKPWKIESSRSHILHSKCSQNAETCITTPCNFCVYSKTLELKHLPDMVFPNNILSLTHEAGARIEFNALDALKRVENGKIDMKLPLHIAMKVPREDPSESLEAKVKYFDWTFTTDYMGTISGFHVEETEERINFEGLKRRNEILFYTNLTLYEDEVHDRGIASLSVKIRNMDNTLFVLLRYFLRIDHHMIRINDTRFFHDLSKPYILREYTSRESKIKCLNIPSGLLIEPSLIADSIPLIYSSYHKLSIPPKSDEEATKSPDDETENDTAQPSETNSEI